MKKFVAMTLILFSGIATGFYAAVSVFAINIDLLGVPYSNTTVELSKSRTIRQGESEVLLPAGSKLTYRYTTKSVPIYSLNIIGGFGETPSKKTSSAKEYFYADTSQ